MRVNEVRVNKQFSLWQNWAGILGITFVFIIQMIWVPHYAATWDQVDFSLGVLHFDMYQMQPHFPGYPYFILGGKLVHLAVEDPVKALIYFNLIIYASALVPLILLMKRVVRESYAIMATAMIYTSSFTVLMVNQPMSEGAAIGFMWWYIWSLQMAKRKNHQGFMILPLFIFSILLGTRLSFIILGVGILYVMFSKWKKGLLKKMDVALYLYIAVLFQLLWVVAIVISEGGWESFLRLALSFTNGHFQEWGGAFSASDLSLFERIIKLTFINTIWIGGLNQSIIQFIIVGSILIIGWRTKIDKNDLTTLLYLLFVSYFLWALFAQNVMKPRHSLPLIGILLFLVVITLFAKKQSIYSFILLSCLLFSQVFLTSKLLYVNKSEVPASYQLTHYLEKVEKPFIVYTWEETRVMEYLSAPFSHKKVQSYEVFLLDSRYYHNRDIYLTNKVVEGFRAQGVSIDEHLKVEKDFRSNDLVDPIYHDITLYKWVKNSE
ncbi:hypothetical protein [Rossellomorea aquimaris]|uniref:hypothetical protein n=1 Tax=Rossellomorea aquimaris TaxID=189382 RepID=UPI0007D0B44A|nr:hypothetical protein [Rossellomorea aquimaris]